MEYHDALRYLYGLIDYEKRRIERYSAREFKIERVMGLLKKLGDPQHTYPTLHIAGTKGKGSVSAMMAEIAQVGNLHTGLYTSPHLHTYRDRIQVNRHPISRNDLAALVEEIIPAVETVKGLTMFEVGTTLAFLHFARIQVDLAVMEVGLGGRLDATNVITPEISIITSLSLDHTSILGKTLGAIAAEKGGIIKPGVPVVTAPQRAEALAVLERISAERKAPLTVVGRDWTWKTGIRTQTGQTLTLCKTNGDSPFEGTYEVSLLGDFQQENAAVAITTAASLYESGHTWVTPDTVRTALQQVAWPGRMEMLNASPPVVVDCAHNPYSAQILVESLKAWLPNTKWVLIYGASSDKDIDGMLHAFLSISKRVIVTRSYHPRAASPAELAYKCATSGANVEITMDLQSALAHAQPYFKQGQGIITTGSVFVVADMREAWAKEHAIDLPMGDWVDEPW